MTQLEFALSTSSTAHLPHSSLAKNHQVNPSSLYVSHFVQRNHCCPIRQGGRCSHSPTHPRGVRGQILWPLLRNSAVLPRLPPRAPGSGTNLFCLVTVTRVIFPAQLSEGSLPRCNLLKDPSKHHSPLPEQAPGPLVPLCLLHTPPFSPPTSFSYSHFPAQIQLWKSSPILSPLPAHLGTSLPFPSSSK